MQQVPSTENHAGCQQKYGKTCNQRKAQEYTHPMPSAGNVQPAPRAGKRATELSNQLGAGHL